MPIRVTVLDRTTWLNDRDIIVGRGDACDLRVDDPSLSRIHASLGVVMGHIRLTDLASSNGTRVNGEPITGSQLVDVSDRIEIGDLVMQLEFVEGKVEPQAVDLADNDEADPLEDPKTQLRPSFRLR